MFKVKVDKQTQSHRCQTAGKVSGGLAEAKYVETSLFTSQAEVQPLSLFSCIFNAAHRVRAIRRSKVQPSCSWYTTVYVRHHSLKAHCKYLHDQWSAHCNLGLSTQGPVLGVIVKGATVKPEWCSRLRDYKLTMTRVIQQNPTFYLLYWYDYSRQFLIF